MIKKYLSAVMIKDNLIFMSVAVIIACSISLFISWGETEPWSQWAGMANSLMIGVHLTLIINRKQSLLTRKFLDDSYSDNIKFLNELIEQGEELRNARLEILKLQSKLSKGKQCQS